MPLDWKEIANRARAFSKDWKHVEREDADARCSAQSPPHPRYALNGGKKSWKTDAERVAFLFTRYEALTNRSAST